MGLSGNPNKASYRVANYLQSVGYRIIPVNPFVDEVLVEKVTIAFLMYPKPEN